MEQEPALEDYIDANNKLKHQVDCFEIKKNILKEQLLLVKNDMIKALHKIQVLEKLLDAPI